MAFKILGVDERNPTYGPNKALTQPFLNKQQFSFSSVFPYSCYLPYNNGVTDASYDSRLYYIQNSCCMVGNCFYIFGGYNGNVAKNDMWRINLDTYLVEALTVSGGPPVARYNAQMAAIGTDLYMWGGSAGLNDTWKFDTLTLTWTELTSDDFPATSISAAGAVSDGTYAYSVCGSLNTGGGAAACKSIYIFDPSAGDGLKWSLLSTEGGTMTPRYYHGTAIHNGKIYIAAGYKTTPWTDSDGVGNAVRSLYEFDIATTTWTRKADLVTDFPYQDSNYRHRYQHGCGISNNRLFIYGGMDYAGSAYLNTGLMYDIANNAWYPTPAIGYLRGMFAMAAYQNRFYIFQGYSGSVQSLGTYIECIYNPKRSYYQQYNV